MINPQENPHLLTQDYFQELLEKVYPEMKVNDIIPFHHQGLPTEMVNPRSIYYGYWTFPCSALHTELSTIKVAGRPDKRVIGPNLTTNLETGTYFDYTWFGMASYVTTSSSLYVLGMTFSGFRATFDNTPPPPVSPIPEPPAGQYQIFSLIPGEIGENIRQFIFQIKGVPNSTVHFRINGTEGGYAGDPWYIVRNSFLEEQFSGDFAPLVNTFYNFPVDFVILDASGNYTFFVEMGYRLTDTLGGFTVDITGATAGTPTGMQSGSIFLP